MRQNPFGKRDPNAPRRRGGLRWGVLLLFAGYAAWYWFSNRSVDPYTGETVLIDEGITPQDEKALGLQAYQEILQQEPPLPDDSEISRQVREIANDCRQGAGSGGCARRRARHDLAAHRAAFRLGVNVTRRSR